MNISLAIVGILSVSLLGALLHFTYHWPGRNPLISLIAPTNEFVWGHMKLLLFPILPFGLWSLKGETGVCRISAFHTGLLMGMPLILVLYYSYASAPGHSILAVDIIIFHIYVIAAFLIYRGLSGSCLLERYSHITSMTIFLLLTCFLPFAYFPPGFSIFKNPGR